jgi:hypothetical protein
MPPVGFESSVSVGERQQTHALDRAVTEIDFDILENFISSLRYVIVKCKFKFLVIYFRTVHVVIFILFKKQLMHSFLHTPIFTFKTLKLLKMFFKTHY